MTIQIDEIVEAVLVRLDESPAVLDEAVEFGSPWFDLRALIRSVMVEDSEQVILLADPKDFGEWLPIGGETATGMVGKAATGMGGKAATGMGGKAVTGWEGETATGMGGKAVTGMGGEAAQGRCLIRLPDDFMRLVYIRMSNWNESVARVADSRDVAVSLRRYWSRRGGANHSTPAVALTYHDGGRALEVFGCGEGSRVVEGGYIPRPRVQEEDRLLFPPSLRGRLIDKIVKTVKEIRG